MSESTPIICGVCGEGNFEPAMSRHDSADFHCTVCTHEANWSDFEDNAAEGESFVVDHEYDLLVVVSAS